MTKYKVTIEKVISQDFEVEAENLDEAIDKTIENVIFNPPATIVFWADGAKTVVKCQDDEPFDPEKGLAMAFMKKMLGNKGNYYNVVDKWVHPYWQKKFDEAAKALSAAFSDNKKGDEQP